MHVPPWQPSILPEILSDSGPLPAIHPFAEQPIERGVIYIAPPDFHLVIKDSKVDLWRGPKEDRSRPSINVLFRSAAAQLGDRVIGTILSGGLQDGATGLAWVKDYGGVTIVQDPTTAKVSSMPIAALRNTPVDYVVKPGGGSLRC
jgi:two-component system chemotaxis response regulator CheB